MRQVTRLLPLLLGLTLAGCSGSDPFTQAGTWSVERFGNANDENLAAMVADPHDLTAGQGEPASLGQEASPAVTRLLAGRRTQLPATSALTLDQIASSPQDQSTPGTGANAGQ